MGRLNSRRTVLLLAIAAIGSSAPAGDDPGCGYNLALPPLEIYDRLPALQMGDAPPLGDRERALLDECWERKAAGGVCEDPAENGRLLVAMLFASGVEKADSCQKYHERFEGLVAKARDAVNDAGDPRDRGERLMAFLHADVMSGGYEADQTSFAAVFDTGRFNCVSSTAMYLLVGARLGLELRPISIPGKPYRAGHASLDLLAGTERIQVEPTNRDGFDWQTKANRPGVRVLGLVPDRKDGHAVDALGVAAMIYSNRGVALMDKDPPRRLDAARCYLAALALGPADQTAAGNLLALFVNWGPELTGEKRFEDAVRVLAFGSSIDPESKALHNNHGLAWGAYIESVLETGADDEAVALIGRAAQAVPDERDFQRASHWFVRHGDGRIRDEGWEAGLSVVERGLKVLPDEEDRRIREWRSRLFRRWSQSLLEQQDAAGSLAVLARGYALDPADRALRAGIAYHTQQALAMIERSSGPPAMSRHYEELCRAFPQADVVLEGGCSHAARAVRELADRQDFEKAVEALWQYQPLLSSPVQRAEVGSLVYDRWARHFSGRQEWQAALDKYVEGLNAFPGEKRLKNNAIATVDEWARSAVKSMDWDEALRIYRIGLEHFPADRHLLRQQHHCEEMRIRNGT